MKRCRFLMLAVAAALSGCTPEYKPVPLPASPDQKPAAAAGQSAPKPGPPLPAEAQRQVASQPPTSSSAAKPPTTPKPSPILSGTETAAARQMPIRLSTGVALAQTLPDGTGVGFSVNYQFVEEEPRSGVEYIWVLERARGKPARIPVRLEQKGNLMAYPRPNWRPEEGPFQGHIEDRSGNRLSESIDLR